MSEGLVATNLDEAGALAGRLRRRSATTVDTGPALLQCDDVLGVLAGTIPSLANETVGWRSQGHEVLAMLSLGVEVAAARTARADRT